MRLALGAVLVAALLDCKTWRKSHGDAGAPVRDAAVADAAIDATDASGAGPSYASPTGGFRVRFPDNKSPEVEEKTIASGGSAIHLFKVQYGSGAYIVTYDDFAKEAGRSASDVLDGAKNGILESTGGTLESEAPLTLAGRHPGIDLTLSATTSGIKMRQRLRAWFVDGRHYQALVVTPDWSGATAIEQDFLDSFALL